MKSKSLTIEQIQQRLDALGVTLIGKYLGTQIKTTFRCSKGHEREAYPAHVFRGYKCSHCLKNARLTKEVVNERLIGTGNTLIGEYLGIQKKTMFQCANGHEWMTKPHSLLQQNKGCPVCNTGYFYPDIPAYGYILNFSTFIKFGITANLDRRMEQHKLNGNYSIESTKRFENGLHAVEWELNVKKVYGGRYVTKKQCPDGYTETLPISLLEDILKTL